MASSSSTARLSPQPETVACIRAPPISSSDDLLADDHLGHARRAEIHRRVALDHDHDVAERRDVRTARGGRPEQAADLRHLARQRDLVVEDLPGAAAAGEHLHLVGDPPAAGVDQPENGQFLAQRAFGDPDDLLDGTGSPGPRLHRRVVRDDEGGTSVHEPLPGHDAVGGQAGRRARSPVARPRRSCPRPSGARCGRGRTACPAPRASRPPSPAARASPHARRGALCRS